MIFNFTLSGGEQQIVEFEKELLDLLIRIVDQEEMLAHEIHFCIHEAILNIIQHTYKWKSELPIEVKLNVTGSKEKGDKMLEIQIKDNGPSIEKPLELPDKIEKFQMRKRGIYMINKIMDEFYIKSEGTTGNITIMKKHLARTDDQLLNVSP